MVFRFTNKQNPVLNLVLEATYASGEIIQAGYVYSNRGSHVVYRRGTTGKWLPTEGITFGELKRTPENLVAIINKEKPTTEIYVLPTI